MPEADENLRLKISHVLALPRKLRQAKKKPARRSGLDWLARRPRDHRDRSGILFHSHRRPLGGVRISLNVSSQVGRLGLVKFHERDAAHRGAVALHNRRIVPRHEKNRNGCFELVGRREPERLHISYLV